VTPDQNFKVAVLLEIKYLKMLQNKAIITTKLCKQDRLNARDLYINRWSLSDS